MIQILTIAVYALYKKYEQARNTAIELVKGADYEKEVAYSIFRGDKGEIFAEFKFGNDGGVTPILEADSATLLIAGHVHNRPTGGNVTSLGGIIRLGPKLSKRGPSLDDRAVRLASAPWVAFVLHEKSFGKSKWRDIEF